MQKWEYATLNVSIQGKDVRLFWVHVDRAPEYVHDWKGSVNGELKKAGEEGWELVAVTSPTSVSAGQVFYFKRPAG